MRCPNASSEIDLTHRRCALLIRAFVRWKEKKESKASTHTSADDGVLTRPCFKMHTRIRSGIKDGVKICIQCRNVCSMYPGPRFFYVRSSYVRSHPRKIVVGTSWENGRAWVIKTEWGLESSRSRLFSHPVIGFRSITAVRRLGPGSRQ